MCCEVFWRNDTLYNGELLPIPSALNPLRTRCTLRMQMSTHGATVSAQRWGSSRGWTHHTTQHASCFPGQHSSPSMIHDGTASLKKTLHAGKKALFFPQQLKKQRSVFNWWCWAPCSTMDESLWMNCHCMTTKTERSEKLICYFAVFLLLKVAIINNFNQIVLKEKQPLRVKWPTDLFC